MGIQVEFNPDLALRDMEEHRQGRRSIEECIPENIQEEGAYPFLKKGQRNYWMLGEIPLVRTDGIGNLSRPLASIVILEATHFSRDGEMYTRGRYLVKDVFDPNDKKVQFEGFERRDY
ncbi:hypothetical protein J4208_04045 [Candidatus Woesearchaeota archaeon]|nr:hypothetical protein [Candidatus Woesearchaeota archaeon]